MTPRIVFMGTPDFAVSSLDAIVKARFEVAAVVTVPDRKSGRGQRVSTSPVKDYALEHGLPILQPEKLRDPLFIEELRSLAADIFVVVAFRMLPQVVWSMPPLGTFNLHASLLPHYRGAAPINWAIINGGTESGVTTFMLNERIDEGEMLLQAATPITDTDNAGTLHDRLAAMGASLVVDTLHGLAEGTLHPRPQPPLAMPSPAPKIFKADCAIDWHGSSKKIHDFVRGLSPYPAANAAMTDSHGNSIDMKIFDTQYESCVHEEPVGTIVTDNKNTLKIAVKDGFVKILTLQISGKRKITASEFLRGYNINNWKLTI